MFGNVTLCLVRLRYVWLGYVMFGYVRLGYVMFGYVTLCLVRLRYVWLGCLTYFQQYFTYIVTASFIGGGNQNKRREPPTCRKSLTNFIT